MISRKEAQRINGIVHRLKPFEKIEPRYVWSNELFVYLLEQFAEEVSISKFKGKWHIDAIEWSVSHKSFPMAICLAFIKWKRKDEK